MIELNSVLSSVKWTFLSGFIRKIFSFALFLLIAKIFDRQLIGVYRELAVLITFFASLSMFSLNTFIVVEQKTNVLKKSLPFVITLGFILSLIVSFCAPYFGKHYQSVILTQILYWSIPFILLEILRQMFRADLQHKMKFKLLSLAETLNVFFYCSLALLIIPFHQDIRIFIVIFYLGNLFELIILYLNTVDCFSFNLKKLLKIKLLFITCLVKLKESLQLLKANFNFLFFSTVATSLNMLMSEFPILILGIYYSPENIGNYFIAFQVVLIPSGLITQSLAQVFTAKFSKLDLSEFNSRLDRFYFTLFELLIPAFLIYCLLIREYLELMFGIDNLNELKWIVLLLFFKAVALLIMNPLNSFFAVLRKTHIEFIWSISAIILTNVVIYLNRSLDFIIILTIYVCLSIVRSISFNLIVFKYFSYSISSFLYKFFILFLKIIAISSIWFAFVSMIDSFKLGSIYSKIITTFLAIIILLFFYLVNNVLSNGKLLNETKIFLLKKEPS